MTSILENDLRTGGVEPHSPDRLRRVSRTRATASVKPMRDWGDQCADWQSYVVVIVVVVVVVVVVMVPSARFEKANSELFFGASFQPCRDKIKKATKEYRGT